MAGKDKNKWKVAVKEEYKKMINIFKVMKKKDLPKGAKVLSST